MNFREGIGLNGKNACGYKQLSKMNKMDHLTSLLNSNRDAIECLTGVVGTGIGLPSNEETSEGIVIQVFVHSKNDIRSTKKKVEAILGNEPFEVIVTGKPIAGNCST